MQAARQSLGLPPPQPSSSFWAHIMGNEKNGSNAPSQSSLPLLTPLDKSATATRLLLHDTQANLEKFSGKVDKLLTGFGEAKSEIKLVKTLFERDRETLINDIIDLVNRCQTQVQNSLGSPVQSSVFDQFSKEVNRLLENLDRRLDAIQTLSQTHAQSLQTQIQAIQVIQEQQCTILSALTPLTPLLQAIPLHIDLAKNSVMNVLQKQGATDAKAIQTSPALKTSSIHNSNKRPRVNSRSDNLAASTSQTNKRFREEREVDVPPNRLSMTTNAPNCRNTPKPGSKRQSFRSNSRSSVLADRLQTPGKKSRTVIDDAAVSLMPSRHIHYSPHQPPASGNTMHTFKDTLSRLTNLGQNTSIERNRVPSMTPPVPLNITTLNGSEVKSIALQSSNPVVLPPKKSKDCNALKRSSTHLLAPQLRTRPPGTPTRTYQLRPAATLLPSKGGIAPPRRRRSPPKEGRRFIPLLDSEDESSIASP